MSAGIPANDDMIAVPRSLLGAALYCVRQHAGTGSETYKALSALAMSPASATFGGIPLSEHARSGAYGWHPGDEA